MNVTSIFYCTLKTSKACGNWGKYLLHKSANRML